MAERSPAFQFYPKDWLSSKRVRMMSRADRGSFIDMLAYCWDSDDCALTVEELAFASGLGDRYVVEGGRLAEMFIPHPTIEGKFTNERLLAERKKQDDWKRKCSKGGKRGAKTKASKRRSAAAEERVKGTKDLVDDYLQVKGNSSSSSSSAFSSSSSSSSTPDLDANASCPPDDSGERRPPPIKPKIAPCPVLEIIALAESLKIPVKLGRDGSIPPALEEAIVRAWNAKAAHRNLDWWRDDLFGEALKVRFLREDFEHFGLLWLCGPKNIRKVTSGFYGVDRGPRAPPGRPSTVDQVKARLQQLDDEEARDGREG